jgi:hypothetical protein
MPGACSARRPDHPPRGGEPRPQRLCAPPSAIPPALKMILDWRALLIEHCVPRRCHASPRARRCPESTDLRRPRVGSRSPIRMPTTATRETADHRDLRQGRHRQELHPRQPQLHDGAAGQEGAADRLRPEERHHSLLFGGRACPTIIETSRKKKLGRRAVAIGDVCFKRDGVFAMELGGPEVGAAAAAAASSTASSCWRSSASTMGLRLRPARLPRRRGLRRLRPADRARHVPEGHRRRLATTCSRSTSPTTSARRWSTSASSAAMSASPAWSSTRTTAPARPQAFRGGGRHPGPRLDPGRRRHPPQERQLRDHRPPRERWGRCSRIGRNVAGAAAAPAEAA